MPPHRPDTTLTLHRRGTHCVTCAVTTSCYANTSRGSCSAPTDKFNNSLKYVLVSIIWPAVRYALSAYNAIKTCVLDCPWLFKWLATAMKHFMREAARKERREAKLGRAVEVCRRPPNPGLSGS